MRDAVPMPQDVQKVALVVLAALKDDPTMPVERIIQIPALLDLVWPDRESFAASFLSAFDYLSYVSLVAALQL